MKQLYKNFTSNQILELLAYRPYLYFSLSVFFSQIAFNMLNVVLIFQVFYLTSSIFSVSLLFLSILIPQILLSFIGGVVADIGSRKKILVFGNLLRAVILIFLFFNFKSIIFIYLISLLVSVITQFYVPAESPLIPLLVGKDKLVAANSIFGIGLFGSILIGYVFAGPAVQGIGRDSVFLFLSAIFFFASFFAFIIPDKKVAKTIDNLPPPMRRSIGSEFKKSFSLLMQTREVGSAFFLLIFSQVIIFVLATLIPGYAKSILQIPVESLSVILFAPASIGMLLSAVLIGSLFSKARKEKLMNLGIIISGIVLILLPFTSRIFSQGIIVTLNTIMPYFLIVNVFNFVFVLAFLAGFANALIFVPSQAVLQEYIPQDFRSKIYGLLFALIGFFSLIPVMIAGGVADIVGVGAVLLSIGIGILLIGLIREKILVSIFGFLIREK